MQRNSLGKQSLLHSNPVQKAGGTLRVPPAHCSKGIAFNG